MWVRAADFLVCSGLFVGALVEKEFSVYVIIAEEGVYH